MNRLWNRFFLVFAALLLCSSYAHAQSPTGYKLSAINFTGLHRYSSEQAVDASGLHVGESITIGDLKTAADRLSRAGAFDSVSFQYSSQGNSLTAQFGVTETKDVLPCIFDNFIWFTNTELDHAVRQRATFYTGESPVRGESVEQIRSALQDLLHANGISGDVGEIPYGQSGKVTGLLFHIDGISMPIKNITFSGEAAVSGKQLSDASAGLRDQDFSVTNVASYASAALLPLYYQRGYLKSQFGRANVSLIDAYSKGPVTNVSITLLVVEGSQYFWNEASWSGNQVLSSDELAKLLDMNKQDVANQEKINSGFAKARTAYRSRGYINVGIAPTRNLDDATKLASYAVEITEGSQFHMGQVYFDGLPGSAAGALLKKWKLKSGDIYNASYPADFLKNIASNDLVQAGVKFQRIETKEEPDPNTLIVNLHIQFK